MDQPQRFGQFLLFRQSESNSYRSCYRAGLARGRAIERIIRLEIFDQPGLDVDQMLNSLGSSADLQEKLNDPHIAAGAGIGQVDGIPYAAYGFELGTTLSNFLDAARQQSFPVPLDQALFIAERIALALAAAYQVEHHDRHVLHSFLTPDSVLLTNEGEVKVSGFEVGHALREQLAGRPFCVPYLSPKCRAGQAPVDQDDVFSLGAILFELVTGEPLSTEPVDLDDLVVQATGEPGPESLRLLLEGSFAPRASRIPHVMAWQQSLGRLILDGEYNPTTFNLAFLMHTLLRGELARGVEDLTQEKRYVLPQPDESELTGEVTAETSSALSPISGDLEEPERESTISHPEQRAGSEVEMPSAVSTAQDDDAANRLPERKPFWIGFSISSVTAGAILGVFLLFGNSAEETPASPIASPANATAQLPRVENQLAPPPASLSAGTETEPAETQPTPVVLTEVVNGELGRGLDEEEVRRELAERTEEIERSLKAEYEQQLESLRTEIINSQQHERAAEREAAPIEELAAPKEPNEETAALGGTPLETDAGQTAPAVAATIPPPGITSAGPTPAEPTQGLEPDGPLLSSTRDAVAPAIETESQNPQEPAAEAEPLQESSSETESTAGPVVQTRTPAQLLRLTPPNYPLAARRLGLSATARVKVLISPEGKVKKAEIVGPAVGRGFDAAALAAARKSRWQPATENGKPVESWAFVTLEFRP